MSEWQPIETAPKDRPILVFCRGGFGRQIVEWNEEDAGWSSDSRLGLHPNWPPVCWAELPSPPR